MTRFRGIRPDKPDKHKLRRQLADEIEEKLEPLAQVRELMASQSAITQETQERLDEAIVLLERAQRLLTYVGTMLTYLGTMDVTKSASIQLMKEIAAFLAARRER
jgi:hypothetical protein